LTFVARNPAQAQTPTQKQRIPLVVKSNVDNNASGELWAWYGPGTALQKLTTWTYNDHPFMSPAGSQPMR